MFYVTNMITIITIFIGTVISWNLIGELMTKPKKPVKKPKPHSTKDMSGKKVKVGYGY